MKIAILGGDGFRGWPAAMHLSARGHDVVVNRFDYDGDYGTVLNRFLVQAAVGHPLTVHGTGGQTRAFIHIQDMVRCVELALAHPPAAGDRVKIFNQMTKTHRVRDLADLVPGLTGAEVEMVPNPRQESAENELHVVDEAFLDLGLRPTTLSKGLLLEVEEAAERWSHGVDLARIPATTVWNARRHPGAPASRTRAELVPNRASTGI